MFDTKFERRNNSFNFNGKIVDSFYAKEEKQKKQILVHNYKDQDNFIISIPDKSGGDAIYLIKSGKDLTVDDVIRDVMKK